MKTIIDQEELEVFYDGEIRKINLVDYGLANRFPDRIEINRNLIKDEKLFAYVLLHELTHTDKKFSLHDFVHEWNIHIKNGLKILFFCIKHPKTLIDFLPIYKRDNEIYYDINIFISWILIILLTISIAIIF